MTVYPGNGRSCEQTQMLQPASRRLRHQNNRIGLDRSRAAPHTLEDSVPSRAVLRARDGLLTVPAGPRIGQWVVVDADPDVMTALRIAATCPAWCTLSRWMSPPQMGSDGWRRAHAWQSPAGNQALPLAMRSQSRRVCSMRLRALAWPSPKDCVSRVLMALLGGGTPLSLSWSISSITV